MKRILQILIVSAAVLVGAGAYRSFIPTRSWLISAGTLTTKNEQDTQEFESKLEVWLERNGFVRAQDPGGWHSWAGVHSQGETREWYRGNFDESGEFLIRASKLQRSEVRAGWNEFSFYHSWHVRDSRSRIDAAENKSSYIAKNFLSWIQQTGLTNESARAILDEP